MHQASNLHNIIKIGAWAEPYVNFIYRETPPPLALIGHAVSEEKMFKYYGNIHVYCPGVGPYEPLGSTFFQNH